MKNINVSEIKAHYRQYLLDMLCKYKTEHFDYNKECMGMLLEELRDFVISMIEKKLKIRIEDVYIVIDKLLKTA